MTARFHVLASGSAGNASLLRVPGFGLLIDAGLGPRQLAERLRQVDASIDHIDAVVLSHTHGDHWNDKTFQLLFERKTRIYCHARHREMLSRESSHFIAMDALGLVKTYECDTPWSLGEQMTVRAWPVPHDGWTCCFRVETPGLTLGYATDLGVCPRLLPNWFADVDILAIEFNHDVALERTSGRSPFLVQRVLGQYGHLSNVQAAELVRSVFARSKRPPRHLVQLHLSRDCNTPHLAQEAVRQVVDDERLVIHTAEQEVAITIDLEARLVVHQPMFPGWEIETW